jgi:uncharacterized protein (DUF1919 family)
MRVRYRRLDIKFNAKKRRELLKDNNFTIISNNCWGGFIYQSYGLSYQSPTIGLYFIADDYIKFLSDLKYYTSQKLEFIKPENSKRYDVMKNVGGYGTHVVGKIDDIEIYFLHYHSEEEAYEKWTRRCKRINWNKLLVKMNDQNFCTEKNIKAFDKLEFDNKIFFSSKKHDKIKSEIFLSESEGQKEVNAFQEPYGKSKYIDLNGYINSL